MILSTPWTIRHVIRYFSFNTLCSHPAIHIEGFNIHALEGPIHIAISISFVAVAAICIDKTNIVLTSPAICIVLTIRWSMSNAIHIAVFNIATVCASMHITPINNIVFNTFNTYCHIRCIAKDKRIELLSLNYCSLGRWLLLWKAGYASSIGGGWNQSWSMHYVIQNPFSISITIINGLIHRTICHRVSAAIRIGLPIRLPRR